PIWTRNSSPAVSRGEVTREFMSEDTKPDPLAFSLTEQVLRKIYGDDFKGCTVRLDDLASVIHEGLATNRNRTEELIELYEKVVEAVHLLSTPPDAKSVMDPNELRSLLSERLDAIHSVTARTMQATTRVRKAAD